MPGAFGFPLKGDGLIALIVGVIFLTAAHYLMFMAVFFPLLGIVLAGGIGIVGTGYFAGYLMTIMERTAHGEKDAPGWPDLDDWQENVLKPFGFILALGILCIGPSVAYRHFAQHEPNEAITYALLAAGLFYMPMGMLCVALANDYAGLSPVPVIRAILSVPAGTPSPGCWSHSPFAAQILGAGLIAAGADSDRRHHAPADRQLLLPVRRRADPGAALLQIEPAVGLAGGIGRCGAAFTGSTLHRADHPAMPAVSVQHGVEKFPKCDNRPVRSRILPSRHWNCHPP